MEYPNWTGPIPKFLTAAELAKILAPYGSLPIRLVVVSPFDEDVDCLAEGMVHADGVETVINYGRQTMYGDIDYCRLTIIVRDDA